MSRTASSPKRRGILVLTSSTKPLADALVWPAPFTLEMRSCGFPNAQRVLDRSLDRTQAHKKHRRTTPKITARNLGEPFWRPQDLRERLPSAEAGSAL